MLFIRANPVNSIGAEANGGEADRACEEDCLPVQISALTPVRLVLMGAVAMPTVVTMISRAVRVIAVVVMVLMHVTMRMLMNLGSRHLWEEDLMRTTT